MFAMVHVADDSTNLRRGIDHIGVSVTFIAHDGNGNVLLERRSAGARDEHGNWCFGSGAIRDQDGVKTHWVAMTYAVQVDPKTVTIGEPDKIDAIDWFTSDRLPSPLHSQFWKSYQIALDMGIVT